MAVSFSSMSSTKTVTQRSQDAPQIAGELRYQCDWLAGVPNQWHTVPTTSSCKRPRLFCHWAHRLWDPGWTQPSRFQSAATVMALPKTQSHPPQLLVLRAHRANVSQAWWLVTLTGLGNSEYGWMVSYEDIRGFLWNMIWMCTFHNIYIYTCAHTCIFWHALTFVLIYVICA